MPLHICCSNMLRVGWAVQLCVTLPCVIPVHLSASNPPLSLTRIPLRPAPLSPSKPCPASYPPISLIAILQSPDPRCPCVRLPSRLSSTHLNALTAGQIPDWSPLANPTPSTASGLPAHRMRSTGSGPGPNRAASVPVRTGPAVDTVTNPVAPPAQSGGGPHRAYPKIGPP